MKNDRSVDISSSLWLSQKIGKSKMQRYFTSGELSDENAKNNHKSTDVGGHHGFHHDDHRSRRVIISERIPYSQYYVLLGFVSLTVAKCK